MPAYPAETLDALREYYQTATLTLPASPKFHQFRVMLPSEYFKVIPDTIRVPEDLRKWLVRWTPLHCYNSVNEFLNPVQMSYGEFNGKKAGYNHAQNILLGDGLLAYDVDYHERSFESAKQDALTVLDYNNERGYRVDEIRHSGMGFHLSVSKHDLHLRRTYSSRNNQAVFDQYRALREPIVKELQEQGVQLDAETTLDAHRIIRTENTVNMKTLSVCTKIHAIARFSLHDAKELCLKGITPVTAPSGMTNVSPHREISGRPQLGEGCSHTSNVTKPYPASSAIPCIYLATLTLGTKDRQVVLLSFKKPVDVEKLKIVLSRFAESESLAPFVLFNAKKDPDNIYALSPSAVQTAGMKRLLRKFPRDNNAYLKFKRRIVPLPIEYVGQSSGVTVTEKPISKAHYEWMKHYGLIDYSTKVLCGNMSLSLPIGEMKS